MYPNVALFFREKAEKGDLIYIDESYYLVTDDGGFPLVDMDGRLHQDTEKVCEEFERGGYTIVLKSKDVMIVDIKRIPGDYDGR